MVMSLGTVVMTVMYLFDLMGSGIFLPPNFMNITKDCPINRT